MEMRTLSPADLPRGAALSRLVGWNQVERDWALFLAGGEGRALDDGQEALAATAAVIRYGPDLAWISMVLVRPDMRRRGHATALMRWAVKALRGMRCAALDATPAGREVYRRLGFRDLWGFARWALPEGLAAGAGVRPMREADWPAVLALDAAAFGAPREALLRDFAARMPRAAFVAEDGSGFALARDGARGPQIGPVVAAGEGTARALIAAGRAALPGTVVLDLPDARLGLAEWLAVHGGRAQRPFTRMALGADTPGDPALLAAVAGPEFG
ncbi:GNAT superfamily N-acetyltransferase [Roseomonas alkaliterrae]|uniref:GNAT superfamily N-acetyltransferase n=2 Tax=Neoroseomonas alkaliterrae TaxID=1452450 RepID=A0A840XUV1_9PROT|nr:GNAT family N-acetyltransferase [Neoroseomonas alkaliterrae]MBB5687927.1 GNAT superfamily N-acetyltransferase [Neoroseomonas alkaliterrae]